MILVVLCRRRINSSPVSCSGSPTASLKERASLEKQWDSGDNVSTEDLRVALQRYRTFFGKLLNAA